VLVPNLEIHNDIWTYLKLNLGLSNVLFATVAAGDLLCLRNLVLDSLGAEVLKSVTLNSVDAELGAGLNSGETAGDCVHLALVECPYPCNPSLI
jgi:hypothetical protein